MRQLLTLVLISSLFLISCEEKIITKGKPIRIGDPSMVVTETDSNNLKNYTADIAERTQNEGDIARIMVQVDSVKVAEELEKFAASDSAIKGFTIDFGDCSVAFDGLKARELTEQNPKENRSVSYLVTKGDLAQMKLKVSGLSQVTIKERVYTKLKVAQGDEEFLLRTLGRKISDWFPLAGSQNIFIALSGNSVQFNDLTNRKIKIALDKELRAKNIKETKIQEWMRLIKNTNDYTDAPCKLYVSTAQFRVRGKNKSGKSLNKLIQFDIVE